jgi:hypothetical protein
MMGLALLGLGLLLVIAGRLLPERDKPSDP